jgi:hypothetical protein
LKKSAATNDSAANLWNLDPEAQKRGESTTGLSKRKQFLHLFIFEWGGELSGVKEQFRAIRSAPSKIIVVEIFRLVLTNFFYLSNIRPVSWGSREW